MYAEEEADFVNGICLLFVNVRNEIYFRDSYGHYSQDTMAGHMSSGMPSSSHGALGPSQPSKRPRLADRPDLTQPLHVDVEVKRVNLHFSSYASSKMPVFYSWLALKTFRQKKKKTELTV